VPEALIPQPISNEDELRRLREVLRQVYELLQSTVYHPQNILSGRHHELLRLGWNEVTEHF